MHARIISERDFLTIHLKIITHKKALFMSTGNDLICLPQRTVQAPNRTQRALIQNCY